MKSVDVRGAKIPAIGLGTWKLEGESCRRMVHEALELGYRHIDTARDYGNEHEVGAAIARAGVPRDEIFLVTKIGPGDLEPARLIEATEDSLAKLRTDYVDALLIHWPNPDIELERTLDEMLELRSRGWTHHVGVSNFPPGTLQHAVDYASVVCNQVEYHPYLDQDVLLQMARAKMMALVAYCPLARGEVMEDPTLRRIGERYRKSPAQVALRWLIEKANVVAIPKASSREHAAANIDIFDFELTPVEHAEVSGLRRGERIIDPEFAPAWDH